MLARSSLLATAQAVAGACVTLVLGLLGIQAELAQQLFQMEEFGSHTGTQSWVLIAPPAEVDRVKLTNSTIQLAQEAELSFAFSQDADSVVLVFDPAGRFDDSYKALTPGSGRSLAATELARVADPAPGQKVIGETPDDRFRGSPLYLVSAIGDGSLGPGYFVFTGDAQTDWSQVGKRLETLWIANELEAVASQTALPPVWVDPSPVYWLLLAAIIAAPVLGLAIIAKLHAQTFIPHYRLAAVSGLSRRGIALRLLRPLTTAWALGCLLGGYAVHFASGIKTGYPWAECLLAWFLGAACCLGSAARTSRRISRELIC